MLPQFYYFIVILILLDDSVWIMIFLIKIKLILPLIEWSFSAHYIIKNFKF